MRPILARLARAPRRRYIGGNSGEVISLFVFWTRECFFFLCVLFFLSLLIATYSARVSLKTALGCTYINIYTRARVEYYNRD